MQFSPCARSNLHALLTCVCEREPFAFACAFACARSLARSHSLTSNAHALTHSPEQTCSAHERAAKWSGAFAQVSLSATSMRMRTKVARAHTISTASAFAMNLYCGRVQYRAHTATALRRMRTQSSAQQSADRTELCAVHSSAVAFGSIQFRASVHKLKQARAHPTC